MTESAYERRRKHIVEHQISGFDNAHQAVVFANTLELAIKDKDSKYKFKRYIGAQGKVIAISHQYGGETTLKTEFLELYLELANFVLQHVDNMIRAHNQHHGTELRMQKSLIREKPQPQTVDANYFKADLTMGRIGG